MGISGSFRLVTVIVIIIIVSSSLGFFGGLESQSNVTSVSTLTTSNLITVLFPVTSTESSTSTTVVTTVSTELELVNVTLTEPFPSLQLIASVSPQNITQGQNVSITAAVYNSLPYSVAVEASPITNPSESFCAINWPTAVTLFPGRLDWSSVIGARALMQYNPTSIQLCGTPNLLGYKFSPESDEAVPQSIPPNNLYPPAHSIKETLNMGGYWEKSSNGTNYVFQEFTPGTYTVLVSDAWEQEMISYFSVA